MHILGMAKSSLNLAGGKASKLELDLFKIAFAVAALQKEGQEAKGCLLILSEASRKRAECWIQKYKMSGYVSVLFYQPNSSELSSLSQEKKGNASGIITSSSPVLTVRNISQGYWGQHIGEERLVEEIEKLHPTITRVPTYDGNVYPQAINWDYYGIL